MVIVGEVMVCCLGGVWEWWFWGGVHHSAKGASPSPGRSRTAPTALPPLLSLTVFRPLSSILGFPFSRE